jgi:hypothetical protein
MISRRFLIVALIAASASACGDPYKLKANLPTELDAFLVFALSGSPSTFPSALNIGYRQVAAVDGGGNFDIAFDLDSANNVVVYPARLVVTPITGVRDVGLQKVVGTFAEYDHAPTGGYTVDKAITLAVGEVLVIQSSRNAGGDICQYQLSPYVFAKVTVDSITPSRRAIWIRSVVNPNCGFHSLKLGIPED